MLYTYGTRSFQDLILAEQAALRGLLNCYLREMRIVDPRRMRSSLQETDTGMQELIDQLDILHQLQYEGSSQDQLFTLLLPLTQITIAGYITYYSLTGQHQYGGNLYVSTKRTASTLTAHKAFITASTQQIVELLLSEVSYHADEAIRQSLCHDLREQINNSMGRTAIYVRSALMNATETAGRSLDYIRSEQSLLYGHPFHPTPKSSEGFTDLELSHYAPEMGASFPLHYMAVSKELICEEWIGERPLSPSAVVEAAQLKLGDRLADYSLLPMHPWQMNYVCAQPKVRKLLTQTKLIDLGPIGVEQGQVVYPTSSVRTVWDARESLFYKLPLHVRITNFIRENTVDQVRRTMDAAIILRASQSSRGVKTYSGLQILAETGYQSIDVPGTPDNEKEQIFASFAVVYRQAEQLTAEEQQCCFVVAALLEQSPDSEEPLLFAAVRQSNNGRLPNWQQWLTAYLELSMLPLVHMLAQNGISLEAHVQNSLIAIDQGAPVRFYVRDLEGISVNRSLAEEQGWTPQLIPADSPVLYAEAEAWKRLLYYFFVNHLGAFIHVIARTSREDEAVYWRTVRHVLMKELSQMKDGNMARKYLQDLLENPYLPAKANLISRFKQRSETPDYVEIPNPIYLSRGNV